MEVQQHQEMGCETLESMLVCTNGQQEHEKKAIKQIEEALKCPRCDSTNTKFCYYNNYSLTQPRYFCKSCRRYWTKGGTLRNVPVGGGCRKNKRSIPSKRSQDQSISILSPNLNTPFSYDSDISLAIARLQQKQNVVGQLGFNNILGNPNNNYLQSEALGLFDGLRGGFLENPNGNTNYQNLYYGNMGSHLENGGLSLGINSVDEEMGSAVLYDQEMGGGILTTTVTETTTAAPVKQEMCNNPGFMGFPWQFGGEGNTVDIIEPGKQNWYNGFSSSSWHGLLNSPLM